MTVHTPAQMSQRPQPGDVVRLRTRTYLVEEVQAGLGGHIVRGSCLDDDAQGQEVEVVWELELGTEILGEEVWKRIGEKGFDEPRLFSAYVHALRWNCVTATNPNLFQAPFRAGIRIDAYQLEPLRKALRLPRVNLFIADDTGLGKTIEAGLIASELLMRRRVREIVVSCPPSMLTQWRDEMESRFGLTFEILNRDYIERVREERGYGVNPWTTFPRFLVSQRLLIDETYAAPLRDWLGELKPQSLLILDEAHHAAPSSGAKYAIDSRITRAIRDLAPRFEHRLFLSATPHNGHSNSFSALLEILDQERFCRGVPVLKKHLDDAIVRRLKEDVRELVGGFPKRNVVQIDLGPDRVPPDAPELVLSRLLNEYRHVRQRRVEGESKRKQAAAGLLISGLQHRLLSSVEAFYRTLNVHKRTMERLWLAEAAEQPEIRSNNSREPKSLLFLTDSPDADADRSELSEEELHALEAAEFEAATADTAGDQTKADRAEEKQLLVDMMAIAEQERSAPDARVRHLIQWIQQHMCPGAHLPGQAPQQKDAAWTDRRIIIFTEWEDTRRYLLNMLSAAIEGTELEDHRIAVFSGPTPQHKRDQIKQAFNQRPDEHPVRILIATDAAREGLNLQAHCAHMFHFDVPWNPSRLEQRNGRIDRKLQPAPEVFCHYYVYTERPEDRVLQVLVRKTQTIREELGSLSEVLEDRLEKMLKGEGIRHERADEMVKEIGDSNLDSERRETAEEELEVSRQRQDELQEQIAVLERRVDDARKWIGLDTEALRDALSCSLEMLGAQGLQALESGSTDEQAKFVLPSLEERLGIDPTWTTTLDTLRKLPEDGKCDFHWRKDAPIRPVVFDAPEGIDDSVVQLHLHHRVVQRLLGRFLSQGFVHHDLSRACLAQSKDGVARVVLLGRLSLYGERATRLHEEILTVTARWSPPDRRSEELSPYARDAEARTMELLEQALKPGTRQTPSQPVLDRSLASIPIDIEQLLPHLETRGQAAFDNAQALLNRRGEAEAKAMREILEQQNRRIGAELNKTAPLLQLNFPELAEERRQYESNRRAWQRWLERAPRLLEEEPARIRNFYQVTSHRIEPIGLVYLMPAGEEQHGH